jgi:polyphosphate kinase
VAVNELSKDRFLNRELAWLDFNDRVLTVACGRDAPLLERVKFLAIFANNLDEFFMVRVAGLKAQTEAGLQTRSADGLTPREQLEKIGARARALVDRHTVAFRDDIEPHLTEAGIRICRWHELDERQQKELDELFADRIFPVVTPLAVDPAHPFPYISNLSLNLAVIVRDPVDERTLFARVKVPPVLPRFLPLADDAGFVPIEDVIAANLDDLFPGMEIVEHHVFRVTRNADLEVDDDGAEDLLQALEEELRRRRFSPAVRLEIEPTMSDNVLELLVKELQVARDDVYVIDGLLDLTGLWVLYAVDRPDLKDEPFAGVAHPKLLASEDGPVDIFGVMRREDILLQHPYDSFTSSVQYFLEAAADDPDVLAIKQTMYRTSGDSPVVQALIEAAKAGKQVVVLVEIKARFDEQANIQWARALERAGCHVVYGIVGLKTHCKLSLVVRQEGNDLARYVHVGTGNYNPTTARLYEDLGLLTTDQAIGQDVSDLFNFLTGYSRQTKYRSLIVAPYAMRERVIGMIDREAKIAQTGEPGRIVLKLNNLVDEKIIDALYRASSAGVRIDLIVRSICALRPGVEGLSENISVRSIVGRFLEHSRVFYFRNGGADEYFIGSADMMHRNLDRRVETLAPVEPSPLQDHLQGILKLALTDNTGSWLLRSDGSWERCTARDGEPLVNLQTTLMERAIDRA